MAAEVGFQELLRQQEEQGESIEEVTGPAGRGAVRAGGRQPVRSPHAARSAGEIQDKH